MPTATSIPQDIEGAIVFLGCHERHTTNCKEKHGPDQRTVFASEAQPMRERVEESVGMRAAKAMPQVMKRRDVLGSETKRATFRAGHSNLESVGMRAAKGMPHNRDRFHE